MKIAPFQLKKFLKKPNVLSGVLVHGSNTSKVDIFVREIITNLNDYSVQVMDFTLVNKSPELLFSELSNICMFNKKKLIKLVNVNRGISKEIRSILNRDIRSTNYIVMVANDLLPYNSETKIYMENSKIFGVISCCNNYSDLYDIISNYLRENGIKYKSVIINRLQSYFNNHSKLPLYLELEKLVLYLGNRKDLKLSDVDLCFSSSRNDSATLDKLYCTIVNKDIAQFIKISDALISQKNLSVIALIRIISSYFLQLESTLLLMENGMSEQTAIGQLSPPSPVKQLERFKSQLKSLKPSELNKILEKLMSLEVTCKRTDLDHKMIFQHGIITTIFKSVQ